ncbi:MAG: tail protein X [Brevundimonas sp.]|uniref:tail protein X n=1 Tax=Brevundimonas sp. TaxID=1871086 RepID=UPI00391C0FAF
MTRLVSPLIARALTDETVDALVFRVIGKGSSAVEAVLEANPNLADLGLFLPRDQAVVIPIAAAGPAARPMIQLWD